MNRYQQNSVAGLPNNGLDRNDSLSNGAGLAALAALRMHSPQTQPPPQRQSQYARSNSLTSPAASRQPVRTNSLSLGNGRANSLRTYVYTPKASYVAGQPTQVPLPQRQPQPQPRLNSLNSNSSAPARRNSLRTNSLNSQSSLRRQLHQPQQQPSTHQKFASDTLFEEEDDDDIVGVVTTTKTTKVVDAQGRTQSITTETIKTLPDGSNIIETRTKNISRSNSLNAMNNGNNNNNGNNRASSLLSNQAGGYNLNKIDEHLHDFDYSYHDGIANKRAQDHDPNSNSNGVQPNSESSPSSPIVDGSISGDGSPNPKPLRSILKNSAKNVESIQEKYAEQDSAKLAAATAAQDHEPTSTSSQVEECKSPSAAAYKAAQIHGSPVSVKSPKGVLSSAAAAAAAAASSKMVTSTPLSTQSDNEYTPTEEQFSDALETLDKRKSFIEVEKSLDPPEGADSTLSSHPYQNLKTKEHDAEFKVPNLTHESITPVTLQPSPVLTTTRKFSNSVEQQQTTPSNIPLSTSSSISGSIKFNDKVETIGYASSYQKPLQPPPSKAISEEEMYEKALEVAKIRVFGETNEASSQIQKNSVRAPSPPQQQQTKDKRTMSITSNLSSLLDEARRNKKLNMGSPSQQQSPPAYVPHFNTDEVITGSGVKDDYHYQNHHKDFSRHSMRGAPQGPVVDTTRKDRAKEEKNFAKQRAKEEKLAKKQASKEAVDARKKAEKEEKQSGKAGKRSTISFFTKKKDKQSSIYSGSSIGNGSVDYETPQVTDTTGTTFDSIDETPISTNPLSGGDQPFRSGEQLSVSLPITPVPVQVRSTSSSPRTPVAGPAIIEEEGEEGEVEDSKAGQPVHENNTVPRTEVQQDIARSPITPKEQHIVHVPEINGKKQKRGLFSKLLGKKKSELSKKEPISVLPSINVKPADPEVERKISKKEPSIENTPVSNVELPEPVLDQKLPETPQINLESYSNEIKKTSLEVGKISPRLKPEDANAERVVKSTISPAGDVKEDFDPAAESLYSDSVPNAYEPEAPKNEEDFKEPLPHPSVIDVESIHKSISESMEVGEVQSDADDESMLDEFTKKLRAAAQTVTRDDGEADETFDETFDRDDNEDNNLEYDNGLENKNILGEISPTKELPKENVVIGEKEKNYSPPDVIYIPKGEAPLFPASELPPALGPAIKTIPSKHKQEQNLINGQSKKSVQELDSSFVNSKLVSEEKSGASNTDHLKDFVPPSATALNNHNSTSSPGSNHRNSSTIDPIEGSPKSVQSTDSRKSKFRQKILKYFVHTYEK